MGMNRNVVFALTAFLLLSAIALADPAAPTALSAIGSSSRDLGGGSQTVGAQGGNVTEINIAALTVTKSWQGYYGEISGEITLDDGRNMTFYNWSMTRVEGEVYATRNSTITWTSVVCANSTHVALEEAYLGQTAVDGDSVSNTFNRQAHPSFELAARTFNADSCNTTNAFVQNASQSADFTQVLLHQNDSVQGNVIYMTIINDTTLGFDGETHDFQLLVGENERAGSIGATNYYFWVELG